MNFMSTVKGSMLEDFYPSGWDMEKINRLMDYLSEAVFERQPWWNPEFTPVMCDSLESFDVYMGHEIAMQIKQFREKNQKLILILPVGPMGMYKWAVYFLKEWNINCDHLYCFNMDEWADGEGNTLDPRDKASFQNAMNDAFYDPLGRLTVPENQRHFATKECLPKYFDLIGKLKAEGARQALVFGIGRMCHIAFCEPHFAEDFESDLEWSKMTHRLGAKLHPLTIEQNAITSFKSRTTLVPCRANTIGPAIFLNSDYIIGGCDGAFPRGMGWQGMSLWMTLRHEPTRWIPSTYMTTLKGKLFFISELAGPLVPECN